MTNYKEFPTLKVTSSSYQDSRAEDSWIDPNRNEKVTTISDLFEPRAIEIIKELCIRKGVVNPQEFTLHTSSRSAPYSFSRSTFLLKCIDENIPSPIVIVKKETDNRYPDPDPREEYWVNENDLLPRSELKVRKLGFFNEIKAQKEAGELLRASKLIKTINERPGLSKDEKQFIVEEVEHWQGTWLVDGVKSESHWQWCYQNALYRKDYHQCGLLIKVLIHNKINHGSDKKSAWASPNISRKGTCDIPAQAIIADKTQAWLQEAVKKSLSGLSEWKDLSYQAIQALGHLGNASALPVIFDYLKTAPMGSREQDKAHRALARIGSPRVYRYFINYFQSEDKAKTEHSKFIVRELLDDMIENDPKQPGAKKAILEFKKYAKKHNLRYLGK